MARPLVFLKVEWMEFYDGRKGDKPEGKFGHVRETGQAHEDLNFLRQGRYCYGYAPIIGASGPSRIRLDKHFAANADAEYLDHVDVVFIASHPDGRGVFVVGWYSDARLYAEEQRYAKGRWCRARVDAERARRVPVDSRWFRIDNPPRRQNLWYADKRPDVIAGVRKLMRGEIVPPSKPLAKKPDTARKILIETRAYDAVSAHFEAKGFTVEPVWRDHVGWDLEAHRSGLTFRIEVKGTDQSEIRAELTPNEYTSSDHESYRICIVTNALTTAKVHTFVSNYDGAWFDESGGLELHFEERTGARLSVSKVRL